MTLSRGRDILAIPGPSIIPDRVLAAMQRPAPNIYEGELVEMTETIVADLARVARTAGKPALYIGNGHAAWEAAIANILAPGHNALVVATGRFGLGWAQMARVMNQVRSPALRPVSCSQAATSSARLGKPAPAVTSWASGWATSCSDCAGQNDSR